MEQAIKRAANNFTDFFICSIVANIEPTSS